MAIACGCLAAAGSLAAQAPTARQIVIRVADGGTRPDQFCMPTWSVSNETGTDIGDLLIHIEWRKRSTGEVLQAAGQFGTMVRGFAAGTKKNMFVTGYQSACSDLQMVVSTYACRDKNAVRQACPGTIGAQPQGGVTVDTSAMKEGPMRGAVERR